MKSTGLLRSFNYAIEGVVHTFRTQRNFKIHFLIGALAIILGLVLHLDRIEFIILMISISFVLGAELLNTAIEAAIDVVTTTHDPLAKIAKDVAASAVLIAALNAIFVGYFLFFDHFNEVTLPTVLSLKQSPIHLTVAALFITVVAVISFKAFFHDHSYLQGGLPSGHTAIAFALFTAITIISRNVLVASLSLLLALIVMQSRVDRDIHTWFQVISGAVLGTLVVILIFQIFQGGI